MSLQRWIKKPEYVFRPGQFLFRLKLALRPEKKTKVVKKILEQKFSFNPKETIGKSILHLGVYDLALTETIWRLVQPGHKVIDVGANIGYFSLVLAQRVGAYGEVHCFEPHPQLQKSWKENLLKRDQCRFYPLALSNQPGEMELYIPQQFKENEGIASLEKMANAQALKVKVSTLDELFKNKKIDLIKIDVEGHEFQVFQGGAHVLKNTKTVLFEDFHGAKSKSIQWLKELGFSVYRMHKGFRQVHFLSVEEGESLPLWEPPNYMATRAPQEVFSVMKKPGWVSLKFI